MKMTDALLQEFDAEMANTRKTLERVPPRFDWKPHEKSMSMGRLAIHLSEIPMWAEMTLRQTEIDIAPVGGPQYQSPELKTPAEVLAAFDKHLSAARDALKAAKDEDFQTSWTLKSGGKPMMTMPRSAVFRNFVMNHMVHHRAQMGVYLRLNDIPVPSLYGPSADEGGR